MWISCGIGGRGFGFSIHGMCVDGERATCFAPSGVLELMGHPWGINVRLEWKVGCSIYDLYREEAGLSRG